MVVGAVAGSRCSAEITEGATSIPKGVLGPGEKAQLDYEAVLSVFQLLTDVRFKLLALVPTISGTAVALLTSSDVGQGEQVVVASLGFIVTLGIVFYEQRNTQLYNNAIGRAKHLETNELKLSVARGDLTGGLFSSRKREARKLFGVVPMWHDRGLALVYAPVLGAWGFSALEAVVRPRTAAAAGAGIALAFFIELERQNDTFRKLRKRWRARRALLGLPRTSDMSGRAVPPGDGARVRIFFDDATTPDRSYDLIAAEAKELIEHLQTPRSEGAEEP
ncbi:MAG: hypothetical protein LC808_37490 [Actinobacteria bacterium]|nr:hypothetical protein [Actinomycetota bacterium]